MTELQSVLLQARFLTFIFVIVCSVSLVTLHQLAYASHTVSATPAGGSYNSTLSVSLASSEPLADIFFSLDGSAPTTNSTLYNGTSITVTTDTTLQFLAVDPSDNHTSAVVTETYVIDTTSPTVTSTEPESGARRIDSRSVVNATFSEAVNETTLDTNTFTLESEFGYFVSGSVSYDSSTDTASFTPDFPLNPGEVFTAKLSDEIKDNAGNNLESFSWSFTTGGRIRIDLFDVQTFAFIANSTFTITPNPFTLVGSLDIEDNGNFDSDIVDFGSRSDGTIIISNVENDFTTYTISQSVFPNGYSAIYGDSIVSVVQSNTCFNCTPESVIFFQNLNSSVAITDVDTNIGVPPPFLNRTQFELFNEKVIVGIFSGIQGDIFPTLGLVDSSSNSDLPSAQIVTLSTLNMLTPTESLNFELTASETLTGAQIIDQFEIPTYPGPVESIAPQVIYSVPAVVIPYDGSANNFVLTPVIAKVFPGLVLFMNQSSFVESEVASVRHVNMTFNVEGNNVGFSFGITDTRPPGTPKPPLDSPALFLDIGFVGDVDFSDPDAFLSSPKIDILVNKTLTGFDDLPDGCSDFVMLFFDEDDNEWKTIQKLRNPTIDTEDECGYTLLPEHFSTFAVGGVKGNILVTDVVLGSVGGGGGGGSSSTSIRQMNSGENVVVTTDVGTATVVAKFEFVEPGSGQLKIESGPITNFEGLFDEIVNVSEGRLKQGIVQLNDAEYSTAGTIFDVDATDVTFRGTFDITISYEEELVSLSFGSESDIRLLHYNTELEQWEDATIAVDQESNTVTGRLYSTSPVVAALMKPVDNPMKQFRMSDVTILDPVTNLKRLEITKGEQVTVTVMLENMVPLASDEQTFVFIVEVIDENGMATDVSVQNGSLDGKSSIELARSWTENETGLFTLKIFVWNNLEKPEALSDVATVQARIS